MGLIFVEKKLLTNLVMGLEEGTVNAHSLFPIVGLTAKCLQPNVGVFAVANTLELV